MDGTTGALDMSFSNHWEIVKDREPWHATVHGFTKRMTERLNKKLYIYIYIHTHTHTHTYIYIYMFTHGPRIINTFLSPGMLVSRSADVQACWCPGVLGVFLYWVSDFL